MRLRSLTLERYGHFRGCRLEFPPDRFCVVHGRNEAGKSTALAALSDLLYGFPHRTPYDFRFDPRELRLGGEVMDETGASLAFRRRKGRKATLLDAEDRPLDDDVLAPFLGRSDRELFEKAFGLSHHRLRQGGAAMLEAGGDVAGSLIEAGGIDHPLEIQRALREEADALYGDRRASSKPFNQAYGRFEAARERLRGATLGAEEWWRAGRAVADAGSALERLREASEVMQAERGRITRLRRVMPVLGELDQDRAELADLPHVPDLPVDAVQRRQQAVDERIQLEAEGRRIGRRVSALDERIAGFDLPQPLLERRREVESLHDERIGVLEAERDLPICREELRAVEAALAELAAELGYADAAALDQRQPDALALAGLQDLVRTGRELHAALRQAEEARGKAAADLAEAQAALDAGGGVQDPGVARRQLEAVRATATREDEQARGRVELGDLDRRIGESLAALPGWQGDAATLAALSLPARATVRAFEQRRREMARRRESAVEQAAAAARRVEMARQRIDSLTAAGEPPTLEALDQARRRREQGWQLLRRRYVNAEASADRDISALALPHPLPDHYERWVAEADDLADRRGAEARRIADFAQAEAERKAGERERESLARILAALDVEDREREEEWQALWAPLGLATAPDPPEAMEEWLDRARTLRDLREERELRGLELERLEQELARSREILAGLAGERLGPGPAGGRLVALLPRLEVRLEEDQARWDRHRQWTATRAERHRRVRDTERLRNEAEVGLARWRRRWAASLSSLGLGPDLSVDQGEKALDLWREVSARRAARADLRRRVAAMAARFESFGSRVSALAAAVAPELDGPGAREVVTELHRRLQGAERQAILHRDLSEQRAAEATALERARDRAEELDDVLAGLMRLAGVSTDAELERAIARANRRRVIEERLGETRARLLAAGDGREEAELRREADGLDLDDLAPRQDRLDEEIAMLGHRREEAARTLEQARAELAALRARGSAGEAAQDLSSARAELARIARDWAELRSAALLLKAAIDRYRERFQSPMLESAGRAFERLTLGAFRRFAVDYDEGDQPRLVGERSDGSRCPVAGMSDGTRDQLYLALRLAALQAYCRREAPLPFVGDDLFVHFDDERAAAGIGVLAELESSQVLMFTHHRHLVDLARAHLGPRLHLIEL